MNKLLIILILFIPIFSSAQKDYLYELSEHRQEINREFKDPESSPLTKKDRRKFKELEYFPGDTEYRVQAILVLHKEQDTFMMKTTTERMPVYVKYGELHFELQGKDHVLQVYQNVELSKNHEEYADYLFLPFLDETSGLETYGGGRYLDVRIPEDGNIIILDFNKAYNPYCAYNKKYSCPLVPYENRLPIRIEAGVLSYH